MNNKPSLLLCIASLLLGSAASPSASADNELQIPRVVESERTITVQVGTTSVLVYNKQSPAVPDGIDPIYGRSGFIHPVSSPGKRVVTAAFPFDHPHQHGIFSAWVNTTFDGNAVDFWNLAGGTGRVAHHQVISLEGADGRVGFEVELRHRTAGDSPQDVLRETWKVTLIAAGEQRNCFDIESTQAAITELPLRVNQYHYGGMAFRGPTAWLEEKNEQGAPKENCRMVNSLGDDRLAGNHAHAKWVAMTGNLEGKAVSVAVLSHRENFRFPQAARLHPTKPYFVFSPCVDGEFVIDKQHALHNRFRYIVTDSEPDSAWLDAQWDAWCGPGAAK